MSIPKILVIDDELALRKAMQKALKNDPYHIVFAENGREGLAQLKKEEPDLIFLDLRMPVMDGFGFLEHINIKPEDPYLVVVITGQTIINNTIDEILSYSEQAFKVLLGPSAPLSPILFDYGIDVLAGVKISKCEQVNRYIRQGVNFRQLKGVELIMMGKNAL